MSENGFLSTRKKKSSNETQNNALKNNILYSNKILNSHRMRKIENDDDFTGEYSSELLNENIKLSGMLSPFINPIPCFTVKNDNYIKKEIKARYTFCKNLKNQINLSNKKDENKNENELDEYFKDKTKIIDKKLKKSHINNRYFPHSPILERKKNKLFKSDNESSFLINYEFFHEHKKNFIGNLNRDNHKNKTTHKLKPVFSCNQKKLINNKIYYSIDNNLLNPLFDKKLKEVEEKKSKKFLLMKLLGQKINVAKIRIEILENYKKKKNLNEIKKKIEFNKVLTNNELKRLKEKYFNSIQSHLSQIKFLKMKLLKFEESFMSIKEHKNIIDKEELLFKNEKMELIERIIILQIKKGESANPDIKTNDTYHNDDSFEEQTIKDISFNDFSLMKDSVYGNHNINKSYFNDESLYENKFNNIITNEINIFSAKFINTCKDKIDKK